MENNADYIKRHGTTVSVREFKAFCLGQLHNTVLIDKYFPKETIIANCSLKDYFILLESSGEVNSQEMEFLVHRARLFLRLLLPPQLW